jgi:Na+/proline symporter
VINLGNTELSLIDYGIFFVALIAVLVVGLWSSGKTKSLEDYATSSGHRFSAPVLAMTLIVTDIGGNSSMGAIAEVYKNGVVYVLHNLSWIIGAALIIPYAARFIAGRYYGQISLYGVIEQEYGTLPAKFSAVLSAFISLVLLSLQIMGMGYIAKTFLGISFFWGAIVSSCVFIFYSTFSGIRGVVYTDVLQFFVVFIVFPVLVGLLIYKMGGIDPVLSNLPEKKKQIIHHEQFIEYAYLTLFWLMPFGFFRATFIQRFLMCSSGEELKKMGSTWILFKLGFTIMIGIVGLTSINLLPEIITSKEVIPALMKNYLPIGFKGLAITAFFAIIMSTADSELNASTVLIAEVFSSKGESPVGIKNPDKKCEDKKQSRKVRGISIMLGCIALGLALLDFAMVKSFTIASAIAFSAVNIPIFFAPFKENKVKAEKAYIFSIVGGFSVFLILWAILGQERMFMVSFYSMLSSIAGWFIGVRYFDKLKTNFWKQILEVYAPNFKTNTLLEVSKGYNYFAMIGILIFLMRYIIETWPLFARDYVLISLAFTVSCLLMVTLYFGDIIKSKSRKFFIAIWLLALFFALPFYNMIALLHNPSSIIDFAGLMMSVFILNLILNWRLATFMLVLSLVTGLFINSSVYHREFTLPPHNYIYLTVYVIIAGVLVSLLLKKMQENAVEEKLNYANVMACSVAHELKEPIITIGMMLDVTPPIKEGPLKIIIDDIRKSQLTAYDNISRTMQIFKIGHGSDDFKDTELNLAEMVHKAVTGANIDAEERITVKVDPQFTIKGYESNLITVLQNLIYNAYTYALVPDPEAKLDIYTMSGNKLIVHDTGPGIRSDRLQSIFERGVTYGGRGTGFGLYYCKIEMERMGGDISCFSHEGEFTRFVLTFKRLDKSKKIKGESV